MTNYSIQHKIALNGHMFIICSDREITEKEMRDWFDSIISVVEINGLQK
jgi:hypothetical protein